MNVLLISTPWQENPLYPPNTDDNCDYPLGLAYLHSYLESKGHSVYTEWLNNYPLIWKVSLEYQMRSFKPDVVGFNCLTINRVTTFEGIEWLHSKHPDVKIVLGGIHPTIMYQQILEKYPYVVIVRGEGELTFEELLTNPDLATVKGIAYSDNGKVVVNPDRELIADLDILPFPKHDLFFDGSRTVADVLFSRGCPGNCSFCCLNPISKKTVRFRSVENAIKEIEYLVATFPKLKTIWVQDDSFFTHNQWVIKFCDEIIARGIKIEFRVAGRAKPICEEMVVKLEQAGVVEVRIGLESGDTEVLRRCHKGITTEDVTNAFRLLAKTRMVATLYIIIGLPGESTQSAINSGLFIQSLQKIKYNHIYDQGLLIVYPGTEVYRNMVARGILTDSYWMTDKLAPFYTVDNTYEELIRIRDLFLLYVRMESILTVGGFIRQWRMIPYVILYNLQYVSRTKQRRWLYEKYIQIVGGT